MAGTFLLLYMAGMLLLLLGPHAILLSVTGHLYPSPFVSGILQTMSLGFVLTSLLYAVLSFHLRGWQECLSVLYWGIQRYDVWILISMLAAQLYNALCYVWNGA